MHHAFAINETGMVRRRSPDPKKGAFWRQTIRGQRRSGMSIRAWCRGHALREASFYWWRTRLAQRDAQSSVLVPVRITVDSPAIDAVDALRRCTGGDGASRLARMDRKSRTERAARIGLSHWPERSGWNAAKSESSICSLVSKSRTGQGASFASVPKQFWKEARSERFASPSPSVSPGA